MKFSEFKDKINSLDAPDDAIVDIETCCEGGNVIQIAVEPRLRDTYVTIYDDSGWESA